MSGPPPPAGDRPLFTVVIPVYNRGTLIGPALDTVAVQTESDREAVVVDDGSTDDTAAVAEAHPTRPRVIRRANAGPAAARNAGIAAANGEYVAFLDSDDLWFSWTLEIYRRVIERHGRPAFIAGRSRRFRDDAEMSSTTEGPLQTTAFPNYLASGDEWRWFGVSSFVVRRDVLETVGGFSPERMNGEDADLALKLGTAGGFVQVTSPLTFAYREHPGNITGDPDANFAGLRHMLATEAAGGYPGGTARRAERRRIITRHVRPFVLDCIRRGQTADAWELYWATFPWHTSEFRLRFLAAVPALAAVRGLRGGAVR